jgi:hypothetical protein
MWAHNDRNERDGSRTGRGTVALDDADRQQIAAIAAEAATQAIARLTERQPGSAPTNGLPMPPTNASEALAIGPEADLMRWRHWIRTDEFPERIDVSSREAERCIDALFADGLRRHAANVANGRGDLGRGAASFYPNRPD